MRNLPKEPPSSEITPEAQYDSRREFIKNAGLTVATASFVGCGLQFITSRKHAAGGLSGLTGVGGGGGGGKPIAGEEQVKDRAPDDKIKKKPIYDTDEAKNSLEDISTYNNFYEFGTGKDEPAQNAHTLKPKPWSVAIKGEVEKEQRLDFDDIVKMMTLEERVYRMRCVEAWSMVIPWRGFMLADLIKKLKPKSSAKYVAFKTLLDPKQMPGQNTSALPWPYVEGLRMDEAMNPLTLLATGIYGKALPNQCGAPLRLVTPWKYGFKGIKSIVEISFTEKKPVTTWNRSAPNEYGFFANVNPEVDHPRWSQETERRIGEFTRRKTLKFNGYGEFVASMYEDMDLAKSF